MRISSANNFSLMNVPLQSFSFPKAPSCKHFFTVQSSLVQKILKLELFFKKKKLCYRQSFWPHTLYSLSFLNIHHSFFISFSTTTKVFQMSMNVQ